MKRLLLFLAIFGLMSLFTTAAPRAQDTGWGIECFEDDPEWCYVSNHFYVAGSGDYAWGSDWMLGSAIWKLSPTGRYLALYGARVSIDQGPYFEFDVCDDGQDFWERLGCYITFEDGEMLDAMRSGSFMTIEVYNGAQWHDLTVSLDGYHDAELRSYD